MFLEYSYFSFYVCVDGDIDVFRVDFEGVGVGYCDNVGGPVDVYFLFDVFKSHCDLYPGYFLLDRVGVSNGVIVDSLYDFVAIVGDEFVDKGCFGCE